MLNKKDFYITINHRGRKTKTIVGSKSYSSYINNYISNARLSIVVSPGYEHRPDNISYAMLGNPDYMHTIMNINNLFDPFEDLRVGDTIIG